MATHSSILAQKIPWQRSLLQSMRSRGVEHSWAIEHTHISDIIWYLSFFFWLTSLCRIISRSIHVAANGIISHFFMANISHLLYLFIYRWTLGWFHVLATVNSTAMNIGLHVSFWVRVSSEHTSRSGITIPIFLNEGVYCGYPVPFSPWYCWMQVRQVICLFSLHRSLWLRAALERPSWRALVAHEPYWQSPGLWPDAINVWDFRGSEKWVYFTHGKDMNCCGQRVH